MAIGITTALKATGWEDTLNANDKAIVAGALTGDKDWITAGCTMMNGWQADTDQPISYKQIKFGTSGVSLFLIQGTAGVPSGGIKLLSSNVFASIPKGIAPDHSSLLGQTVLIKSGNYIVAMGEVAMQGNGTVEQLSFEPADSIGNGMGFADPVPNGILHFHIAFTGGSL